MTNDNRSILTWCAVVTAALFSLSACASTGKSAHPATTSATAFASPSSADAPEIAAPRAPEPEHAGTGKAIIHTTQGPIAVTFFPDVAPKTVAHIVALMTAGCYTQVDVFRLEPNFVAQIAPVPTADCHPQAMDKIAAEFSNVSHKRLYLSMARWDDVDSATSSFSIMLGSIPSMDGEYTVFGRVIDGVDTIEKIEALGSTKGDDGMRRPNTKVTITRVEVVESVD